MEAPSGFEPEMEVLQTSALPLGDGADRTLAIELEAQARWPAVRSRRKRLASYLRLHSRAKVGAGNGIRTRDFDLGKVALYH